jgi:DNA invertase Pin-like site-specific DNA recombinase
VNSSGSMVGYARVSTQAQDPGPQVAALQAAGCGRVFIDRASGAKKDRPQFAAALDYLRRGDRLVVTRLDRLSRTLRELIETADRLEKDGVELVSLSDHIDTSSPSGRLVFHVISAISEFERELARDRTRVALEARRSKGVPAPRRSLDPKRQQLAQALLDQGVLSAAEVARRAGISRSSLYVHCSFEEHDRKRETRKADRNRDFVMEASAVDPLKAT